jgi:CRISPR-associated protein Cmr6
VSGVAAVPHYVGRHTTAIEQAPPGHRFGLFFPLWNNQSWGVADQRGGKQQALQTVLPLGVEAQRQLSAVRERQRALADATGALTIDAVNDAPFMTGVGMEHPLENGFAFLNPYGLPYLPGASVKGVLRKAAEALALDPEVNDRGGWDIVTVWALLGFDATSACLAGADGWDRRKVPEIDIEAAEQLRRDYRARIKAGEYDATLASDLLALVTREPREIPGMRRWLDDLAEPGQQALRREIHLKGALAFWDVFPDPADGKLAIDILTPHYGPYYQPKDKANRPPPADCYSPVPVPFLTVPPNSAFRFHVSFLDRPALPASLRDRWRDLIGAAFDHAFAWHGFGAKTAVGYGQLRRTTAEELQQRSAATPAPATARRALPAPGSVVDAVLVEEKTRRGGWKAQHSATGVIGPIQNTADVPADKQPGDTVTLIVANATDFKWPTEADLARAASQQDTRQAPRGPQRRGRR